jgi:hypothetical protein
VPFGLHLRPDVAAQASVNVHVLVVMRGGT